MKNLLVITLYSSMFLLNACGSRNKNTTADFNSDVQAPFSEESLSLAVPRAIPAGFTYEGVGFTVPKTGIPVYRLFHPVSGNHFYTANIYEAKAATGYYNPSPGKIVYRLEGIAFYASASRTRWPVHRLYKASTNHHLYTATAAEIAPAQQNGYSYEGVAFYAKCFGACEDRSSVNIHRFKKPGSGLFGGGQFLSITGQ